MSDAVAEFLRDSGPAFLRELLDAVPQLFFLLDRQGNAFELNQCLPEKMNLGRKDLHGQSVFAALPPHVGSIQWIDGELGTDHSLTARLEVIEKFALNGARLTRQLLGFARGEKYLPQVLEAGELIAGAVEIFSRTRRGIRVEMSQADPLPRIDGDRSQLLQVPLDLMINAAQAMRNRGRLEIERVVVRPETALGRQLGIPVGEYLQGRRAGQRTGRRSRFLLES